MAEGTYILYVHCFSDNPGGNGFSAQVQIDRRTYDLRYNQKLGFLFSKDELAQFLKEKESLVEQNNKDIENLPLKTFNSKYCFYVKNRRQKWKQ